MASNKKNDRLKRVQIEREKEIPLNNGNLWFLVIYKNGEWDSENNLGEFLEDIESNLVNQVFCVWHGEYRTNLFLMEQKFIINYFKDKQIDNNDSGGTKKNV